MSPEDDLPPTHALILSERLHELRTPDDIVRRLKKGLLKDLRSQAEYSSDKWTYEDRRPTAAPGTLSVTLTSSLNPLSSTGKCNSITCRVAAARAFSRSLALYADRVIVPDALTSAITQTDDPVELGQLLHPALAVFRELLPLIQAGQLRFAAPFHHVCDACAASMNQDMVDAVTQLSALAIESGLTLGLLDPQGRSPGVLRLTCPPLLNVGGHPLSSLLRLAPNEAKAILARFRRGKQGRLPPKATRELVSYVEGWVRRDVANVFFELDVAHNSRSILAAGSRMETLFLSAVERGMPSRTEIEHWELLRSIELPFVRDLSVEEALRLKEDSALALQRLRTMLTERLSLGQASSPEALKAIVQEVQNQATEVEAELRAWRAGGGRRFEVALGSAGVTFVLYGLVTDAGVAAAAIAGALTALATVHPAAKTERVEWT